MKITRNFEKETRRFVDEIRNKIIFLHNYNTTVAEISSRYPITPNFENLLLQYLILEFKVLYKPLYYTCSYENTVQLRIVRLLRTIYSAYYKSLGLSHTDVVKRCTVAIIKLFLTLKTEYNVHNNVTESITVKLLEKTGELDKIKQLSGKNLPCLSDSYLNSSKLAKECIELDNKYSSSLYRPRDEFLDLFPDSIELSPAEDATSNNANNNLEQANHHFVDDDHEEELFNGNVVPNIKPDQIADRIQRKRQQRVQLKKLYDAAPLTINKFEEPPACTYSDEDETAAEAETRIAAADFDPFSDIDAVSTDFSFVHSVNSCNNSDSSRTPPVISPDNVQHSDKSIKNEHVNNTTTTSAPTQSTISPQKDVQSSSKDTSFYSMKKTKTTTTTKYSPNENITSIDLTELDDSDEIDTTSTTTAIKDEDDSKDYLLISPATTIKVPQDESGTEIECNTKERSKTTNNTKYNILYTIEIDDDDEEDMENVAPPHKKSDETVAAAGTVNINDDDDDDDDYEIIFEPVPSPTNEKYISSSQQLPSNLMKNDEDSVAESAPQANTVSSCEEVVTISETNSTTKCRYGMSSVRLLDNKDTSSTKYQAEKITSKAISLHNVDSPLLDIEKAKNFDEETLVEEVPKEDSQTNLEKSNEDKSINTTTSDKSLSKEPSVYEASNCEKSRRENDIVLTNSNDNTIDDIGSELRQLLNSTAALVGTKKNGSSEATFSSSSSSSDAKIIIADDDVDETSDNMKEENANKDADCGLDETIEDISAPLQSQNSDLEGREKDSDSCNSTKSFQSAAPVGDLLSEDNEIQTNSPSSGFPTNEINDTFFKSSTSSYEVTVSSTNSDGLTYSTTAKTFDSEYVLEYERITKSDSDSGYSETTRLTTTRTNSDINSESTLENVYENSLPSIEETLEDTSEFCADEVTVNYCNEETEDVEENVPFEDVTVEEIPTLIHDNECCQPIEVTVETCGHPTSEPLEDEHFDESLHIPDIFVSEEVVVTTNEESFESTDEGLVVDTVPDVVDVSIGNDVEIETSAYEEKNIYVEVPGDQIECHPEIVECPATIEDSHIQEYVVGEINVEADETNKDLKHGSFVSTVSNPVEKETDETEVFINEKTASQQIHVPQQIADDDYAIRSGNNKMVETIDQQDKPRVDSKAAELSKLPEKNSIEGFVDDSCDHTRSLFKKQLFICLELMPLYAMTARKDDCGDVDDTIEAQQQQVAEMPIEDTIDEAFEHSPAPVAADEYHEGNREAVIEDGYDIDTVVAEEVVTTENIANEFAVIDQVECVEEIIHDKHEDVSEIKTNCDQTEVETSTSVDRDYEGVTKCNFEAKSDYKTRAEEETNFHEKSGVSCIKDATTEESTITENHINKNVFKSVSETNDTYPKVEKDVVDCDVVAAKLFKDETLQKKIETLSKYGTQVIPTNYVTTSKQQQSAADVPMKMAPTPREADSGFLVMLANAADERSKQEQSPKATSNINKRMYKQSNKTKNKQKPQKRRLIVPKPEQEDLCNRRITRSAAVTKSSSESTFKPHDFLSMDSCCPSTAPPANKVYTHKLSDIALNSENSNDSECNNLLIDEEDKLKDSTTTTLSFYEEDSLDEQLHMKYERRMQPTVTINALKVNDNAFELLRQVEEMEQQRILTLIEKSQAELIETTFVNDEYNKVVVSQPSVLVEEKQISQEEISEETVINNGEDDTPCDENRCDIKRSESHSVKNSEIIMKPTPIRTMAARKEFAKPIPYVSIKRIINEHEPEEEFDQGSSLNAQQQNDMKTNILCKKSNPMDDDIPLSTLKQKLNKEENKIRECMSEYKQEVENEEITPNDMEIIYSKHKKFRTKSQKSSFNASMEKLIDTTTKPILANCKNTVIPTTEKLKRKLESDLNCKVSIVDDILNNKTHLETLNDVDRTVIENSTTNTSATASMELAPPAVSAMNEEKKEDVCRRKNKENKSDNSRKTLEQKHIKSERKLTSRSHSNRMKRNSKDAKSISAQTEAKLNDKQLICQSEINATTVTGNEEGIQERIHSELPDDSIHVSKIQEKSHSALPDDSILDSNIETTKNKCKLDTPDSDVLATDMISSSDTNDVPAKNKELKKRRPTTESSNNISRKNITLTVKDRSTDGHKDDDNLNRGNAVPTSKSRKSSSFSLKCSKEINKNEIQAVNKENIENKTSDKKSRSKRTRSLCMEDDKQIIKADSVIILKSRSASSIVSSLEMNDAREDKSPERRKTRSQSIETQKSVTSTTDTEIFAKPSNTESVLPANKAKGRFRRTRSSSFCLDEDNVNEVKSTENAVKEFANMDNKKMKKNATDTPTISDIFKSIPEIKNASSSPPLVEISASEDSLEHGSSKKSRRSRAFKISKKKTRKIRPKLDNVEQLKIVGQSMQLLVAEVPKSKIVPDNGKNKPRKIQRSKSTSIATDKKCSSVDSNVRNDTKPAARTTRSNSTSKLYLNSESKNTEVQSKLKRSNHKHSKEDTRNHLMIMCDEVTKMGKLLSDFIKDATKSKENKTSKHKLPKELNRKHQEQVSLRCKLQLKDSLSVTLQNLLATKSGNDNLLNKQEKAENLPECESKTLDTVKITSEPCCSTSDPIEIATEVISTSTTTIESDQATAVSEKVSTPLIAKSFDEKDKIKQVDDISSAVSPVSYIKQKEFFEPPHPEKDISRKVTPRTTIDIKKPKKLWSRRASMQEHETYIETNSVSLFANLIQPVIREESLAPISSLQIASSSNIQSVDKMPEDTSISDIPPTSKVLNLSQVVQPLDDDSISEEAPKELACSPKNVEVMELKDDYIAQKEQNASVIVESELLSDINDEAVQKPSLSSDEHDKVNDSIIETSGSTVSADGQESCTLVVDVKSSDIIEDNLFDEKNSMEQQQEQKSVNEVVLTSFGDVEHGDVQENQEQANKIEEKAVESVESGDNIEPADVITELSKEPTNSDELSIMKTTDSNIVEEIITTETEIIEEVELVEQPQADLTEQEESLASIVDTDTGVNTLSELTEEMQETCQEPEEIHSSISPGTVEETEGASNDNQVPNDQMQRDHSETHSVPAKVSASDQSQSADSEIHPIPASVIGDSISSETGDQLETVCSGISKIPHDKMEETKEISSNTMSDQLEITCPEIQPIPTDIIEEISSETASIQPEIACSENQPVQAVIMEETIEISSETVSDQMEVTCSEIEQVQTDRMEETDKISSETVSSQLEIVCSENQQIPSSIMEETIAISSETVSDQVEIAKSDEPIPSDIMQETKEISSETISEQLEIACSVNQPVSLTIMEDIKEISSETGSDQLEITCPEIQPLPAEILEEAKETSSETVDDQLETTCSESQPIPSDIMQETKEISFETISEQLEIACSENYPVSAAVREDINEIFSETVSDQLDIACPEIQPLPAEIMEETKETSSETVSYQLETTCSEIQSIQADVMQETKEIASETISDQLEIACSEEHPLSAAVMEDKKEISSETISDQLKIICSEIQPLPAEIFEGTKESSKLVSAQLEIASSKISPIFADTVKEIKEISSVSDKISNVCSEAHSLTSNDVKEIRETSQNTVVESNSGIFLADGIVVENIEVETEETVSSERQNRISNNSSEKTGEDLLTISDEQPKTASTKVEEKINYATSTDSKTPGLSKRRKSIKQRDFDYFTKDLEIESKLSTTVLKTEIKMLDEKESSSGLSNFEAALIPTTLKSNRKTSKKRDPTSASRSSSGNHKKTTKTKHKSIPRDFDYFTKDLIDVSKEMNSRADDKDVITKITTEKINHDTTNKICDDIIEEEVSKNSRLDRQQFNTCEKLGEESGIQQHDNHVLSIEIVCPESQPIPADMMEETKEITPKSDNDQLKIVSSEIQSLPAAIIEETKEQSSEAVTEQLEITCSLTERSQEISSESVSEIKETSSESMSTTVELKTNTPLEDAADEIFIENVEDKVDETVSSERQGKISNDSAEKNVEVLSTISSEQIQTAASEVEEKFLEKIISTDASKRRKSIKQRDFEYFTKGLEIDLCSLSTAEKNNYSLPKIESKVFEENESCSDSPELSNFKDKPDKLIPSILKSNRITAKKQNSSSTSRSSLVLTESLNGSKSDNFVITEKDTDCTIKIAEEIVKNSCLNSQQLNTSEKLEQQLKTKNNVLEMETPTEEIEKAAISELTVNTKNSSNDENSNLLEKYVDKVLSQSTSNTDDVDVNASSTNSIEKNEIAVCNNTLDKSLTDQAQANVSTSENIDLDDYNELVDDNKINKVITTIIPKCEVKRNADLENETNKKKDKRKRITVHSDICVNEVIKKIKFDEIKIDTTVPLQKVSKLLSPSQISPGRKEKKSIESIINHLKENTNIQASDIDVSGLKKKLSNKMNPSPTPEDISPSTLKSDDLSIRESPIMIDQSETSDVVVPAPVNEEKALNQGDSAADNPESANVSLEITLPKDTLTHHDLLLVKNDNRVTSLEDPKIMNEHLLENQQEEVTVMTEKIISEETADTNIDVPKPSLNNTSQEENTVVISTESIVDDSSTDNENVPMETGDIHLQQDDEDVVVIPPTMIEESTVIATEDNATMEPVVAEEPTVTTHSRQQEETLDNQSLSVSLLDTSFDADKLPEELEKGISLFNMSFNDSSLLDNVKLFTSNVPQCAQEVTIKDSQTEHTDHHQQSLIDPVDVSILSKMITTMTETLLSPTSSTAASLYNTTSSNRAVYTETTVTTAKTKCNQNNYTYGVVVGSRAVVDDDARQMPSTINYQDISPQKLFIPENQSIDRMPQQNETTIEEISDHNYYVGDPLLSGRQVKIFPHSCGDHPESVDILFPLDDKQMRELSEFNENNLPDISDDFCEILENAKQQTGPNDKINLDSEYEELMMAQQQNTQISNNFPMANYNLEDLENISFIESEASVVDGSCKDTDYPSNEDAWSRLFPNASNTPKVTVIQNEQLVTPYELGDMFDMEPPRMMMMNMNPPAPTNTITTTTTMSTTADDVDDAAASVVAIEAAVPPPKSETPVMITTQTQMQHRIPVAERLKRGRKQATTTKAQQQQESNAQLILPTRSYSKTPVPTPRRHSPTPPNSKENSPTTVNKPKKIASGATIQLRTDLLPPDAKSFIASPENPPPNQKEELPKKTAVQNTYDALSSIVKPTIADLVKSRKRQATRDLSSIIDATQDYDIVTNAPPKRTRKSPTTGVAVALSKAQKEPPPPTKPAVQQEVKDATVSANRNNSPKLSTLTDNLLNLNTKPLNRDAPSKVSTSSSYYRKPEEQPTKHKRRLMGDEDIDDKERCRPKKKINNSDNDSNKDEIFDKLLKQDNLNPWFNQKIPSVKKPKSPTVVQPQQNVLKEFGGSAADKILVRESALTLDNNNSSSSRRFLVEQDNTTRREIEATVLRGGTALHQQHQHQRREPAARTRSGSGVATTAVSSLDHQQQHPYHHHHHHPHPDQGARGGDRRDSSNKYHNNVAGGTRRGTLNSSSTSSSSVAAGTSSSRPGVVSNGTDSSMMMMMMMASTTAADAAAAADLTAATTMTTTSRRHSSRGESAAASLSTSSAMPRSRSSSIHENVSAPSPRYPPDRHAAGPSTSSSHTMKQRQSKRSTTSRSYHEGSSSERYSGVPSTSTSYHGSKSSNHSSNYPDPRLSPKVSKSRDKKDDNFNWNNFNHYFVNNNYPQFNIGRNHRNDSK